MKRFRIAEVEAMASKRPKGYVEAVLGWGRIDGDEVELSDDAWARLLARYAPRRGLGDWVAVVADPVGRWLGLKGCGCERRRTWLNRAGQKALSWLVQDSRRGDAGGVH